MSSGRAVCINCGGEVTENLWDQNLALATVPGKCCTWCHYLLGVQPFNINMSAYNPMIAPDPGNTYQRYPSTIPGAPGSAGLPPKFP